eukprot:2199838-Amphidinium_carterae.1
MYSTTSRQQEFSHTSDIIATPAWIKHPTCGYSGVASSVVSNVAWDCSPSILLLQAGNKSPLLHIL